MLAVYLPTRIYSDAPVVGSSGASKCSFLGALLCSLSDSPTPCIHCISVEGVFCSPFFPTHFTVCWSLYCKLLGSFVLAGNKVFIYSFYTRFVGLLPRSLHLVGRISL